MRPMSANGTPRLHYDDPMLLAFEATVIGHGRFGDRPSVVLDRTAFYPESGGQLGDTGALGAFAVRDVQVDDEAVVHHLVEGELPLVGAVLAGTIEARADGSTWRCTRGSICSRGPSSTRPAPRRASSRLGANTSTIDVHLAQLDEAAVARAEDLVNRVIEDDLVVRSYFPSPDELARLPLRRAPKVSENVRVVDAGGFDVSPCGGTHCTRTAQVGLVTITGLERYKGKMRVTFLAGRAAQRELAARGRAIADVARGFSCWPAGGARGRRAIARRPRERARNGERRDGAVGLTLRRAPRGRRDRAGLPAGGVLPRRRAHRDAARPCVAHHGGGGHGRDARVACGRRAAGGRGAGRWGRARLWRVVQARDRAARRARRRQGPSGRGAPPRRGRLGRAL